MTLFVDTCVWSTAFRRDTPSDAPETAALRGAIARGEEIATTGVVLQELLQGFSGPKSRDLIIRHFSALPLIAPEREDHIRAAELRNKCRRAGVQIGTIDALIGQLCVRHDLTLLTTDRDFVAMASHVSVRLWRGG